ncbi:inositol monophosphatase family protein [Streptomyces sp. NPDC002187]|uniref:inositol monophosphatase family protein n=1 Tax=Streptomyces sp. NPDC002187 TaxID=3364637 RepID=UPI0036A4FB77
MDESVFDMRWQNAWRAFVRETITEADAACHTDAATFFWLKQDGSRVSALDLRLDAAVRVALGRNFPDLAVLSEEVGLLAPTGHRGSLLAIVDPVDGTDSLLGRKRTWWVSIGILDGSRPIAGLIYQPTIRQAHDSAIPSKQRCERLVVGMSPDQLQSPDTARMRESLRAEGADLVSTPHAVEKVASVLEGRCTAAVYLPSKKSPWWHAWDLAACLAIASANDLLLTTLDGHPVRIEAQQTRRSDPWICAVDEGTWDMVLCSLQ